MQRPSGGLPSLETCARVDYSLARRSVLRALGAGRLSRLEVCDAHPDLVRAARNVGEATDDPCPVCQRGPLQLVSYLFADDLPARENGRVWDRNDLAPLFELKEARLYTVEVCTDCSWNHLRSQIVISSPRAHRRARGRGGHAST